MKATALIPLHGIDNKAVLRKIKASMAKYGWKGRPIAAIRVGRKIYALTGSHRIAAATELGIDIPVYLLEGKKVERIVKGWGTANTAANMLREAGYTEFANLVDED